MRLRMMTAAAAALGAVTGLACSSAGTSAPSTACPGINCTQQATVNQAPANAVTILRQTGASPSPGLGSYAVNADGTFPGGEVVTVYTYGTAAGYQEELAGLTSVYPFNFGTYITLPAKLAVIVVVGGGIDASGNHTWGGPTPQQTAARTGGTVAGA